MTKRSIAALMLVSAACSDSVAPPAAVVPSLAGPATQAISAPKTFYGPERFTRTTGAATRFSRTISTAGVTAPFVLHVRSGAADGSSRVSSGRVSLDGVQHLGPRDFNRQQAEWIIPVTAGEPAVLEIELTSKPGSFVDVWITGLPELPTWIALSPTGTPPAGRYFMSTVYDESSDRMIVFGGAAEFPFPHRFNDTWVLSHASGVGGTPAWTQLATAGSVPSPRSGHSAVYDPASNRMIVFGGNAGAMMSEVWVLTHANGLGGTPAWWQLSVAGGPAARTYHTAVYDATGNRMIVFSGNLAEGHCFNQANDVWVLSNANGLGGASVWSQLSPSGGPPGIRNHGGAVYDAASNRMTILFGRVECSSTTQDMWTLTGANGGAGSPVWSPLVATNPIAGRSIITTAYDAANETAIISGGTLGAGYIDEIWVLSSAVGLSGAPSWTQVVPVGTGPGPRVGNKAVYNAGLNRMIVFGGQYDPVFNDVWILTGANGKP